MIGITRGISTLAGAAVAGVLLWFATQVGTQTTAEYWSTYGLIAAAGLTMALSQILGGWTKWGWPRFSLGVFLLGFLPVLVAGGWVLLARQPADWKNTSNWARDHSIIGVVHDLGNNRPAIAFGIGLTFGFSFDTAGPRREVVTEERVREERVSDAQFDECDLTLRDLERIREAFVQQLLGMYHSRIAYPQSEVVDLESRRAAGGGGAAAS